MGSKGRPLGDDDSGGCLVWWGGSDIEIRGSCLLMRIALRVVGGEWRCCDDDSWE